MYALMSEDNTYHSVMRKCPQVFTAQGVLGAYVEEVHECLTYCCQELIKRMRVSLTIRHGTVMDGLLK